MKCADLVVLLGATLIQGSLDRHVRGVQLDSRLVRPYDVFVAVSGQHADGVDYVDQAIERGASAIVTARKELLTTDGVTQLFVPDPRVALAKIACALADHPSHKLDVIGITGTNGKTSTAFLIKAILSASGHMPGLIGSICHEVGSRRLPAIRTTPEAPELQDLLRQMVQVGCDSAVMEVSSHGLHQHRCLGLTYRAGVFTNLSAEHLDYHGTMTDYFETKVRLFEQLAVSGSEPVAIVNRDDEWGEKLWRNMPDGVSCIGFGEHVEADVRAEGVSLLSHGFTCCLTTPWGNADVVVPLLGQINVMNTLAACALCGALGVRLSDIQAGLATMGPIPGRLEPVRREEGQPHVFVDYAHTDDALRKVLETLREVTTGRLMVVFGCGGDRDREKRPRMGRVAAELADVVVLTSDNPRSEEPTVILQEIRSGMETSSDVKVKEQVDRRTAIAEAIAMANADDLVLIAGKGHERYQEFASIVVPFDDRDVAEEVLRGRR